MVAAVGCRDRRDGSRVVCGALDALRKRRENCPAGRDVEGRDPRGGESVANEGGLHGRAGQRGVETEGRDGGGPRGEQTRGRRSLAGAQSRAHDRSHCVSR